MKKIVTLLFWFLFVIALGACNTSSAITETPMAAQPTNTAFISSTSTAPIVPTVDPLTPTAIAQFFATQEAIAVTPELPSSPNFEECSQGRYFTVSGDWALCDPLADPITIINASNQIWQFSYKSFYGKDALLYTCTRLLYSTSDKKYLYFSLDSDCILTEPGFVTSISVFRMNLINGEVSETLKASYNFESNDGNYYSVSISPTGRRIAYIYPQKSPLSLTIFDLQTDEKRYFPLEEKYNSGGMFSWSEDGTKLVFMLESEKDYDHFISMTFLDLLKDDSMVTFIKDKEFGWISSWLEVMDNGIYIAPYIDAPLFYDVETGILSPMSQ